MELIQKMELVQVKFTYSLSGNNYIYKQPLFYLAETIIQQINNENSKKEKAKEEKDEDKKKETNLVIIGNPKLQIDSYNNIDKDKRLFYILNNTENNFEFLFKGNKFLFSSCKLENVGNKIIMTRDECFNMYSEYEISFQGEYQECFDDFIKTSIIYYEKYYHEHNTDKDKINIYITSSDGKYLQYLGKRQKRSIDSIYLPKQQKTDIIEDIERFIAPETKARYLKLGINHKRIYLLEGIPGAGKTSLITALASKFNFHIAIISFVPNMTDVDLLRVLRSMNDYDNINDTSADSTSGKKTIMVFEDIDCIFKERKSHDESKNSITFSGILNALDGITSNENHICFITTNYKNHLDSALLRPGRIDYIMRFDYSTKEQIQEMFSDFTNCYEDISKIQKFYKGVVDLKIKVSTALLQQYLMQYIDKPDDAISNIENLKTIYEKSKVDKAVDETNLYG